MPNFRFVVCLEVARLVRLPQRKIGWNDSERLSFFFDKKLENNFTSPTVPFPGPKTTRKVPKKNFTVKNDRIWPGRGGVITQPPGLSIKTQSCDVFWHGLGLTNTDQLFEWVSDPWGGPGGAGGSDYACLGLKKRGGVLSVEDGGWIWIFPFRRLILFWPDKKNLFYELFSVSKQKVPKNRFLGFRGVENRFEKKSQKSFFFLHQSLYF